MDNHFHHIMAHNMEATDMATADQFILNLHHQTWDIRLLPHMQPAANIRLLIPMQAGEDILLPIHMKWDRKLNNMLNRVQVIHAMRGSGAGAEEPIFFCQC
jgi:hypothetical protein